MNKNNLGDFLNKLSKQRKIKLGDLAEHCQISRTTLYRYTKGIMQIPPPVETVLSKALGMSKAERDEFRRLIALTVQDGSLISSRYVLDDFVFSGKPEKKSANIDFVFHHKDRLLRNSKELSEVFLKHLGKEAFRCDIKVLHCIEEEFKDDLGSMLTELLAASQSVSVEHLLHFPKKDYLTCTKNLLAIIPLFSFPNYQALYSDSPDTQSQTLFLNNVILVETSWRDDTGDIRQFFVLSYLSGALSQCTCFEDEYLFRFFMENYQNYRAKYKNALLGERNLTDLTEYFMAMELTYEQLILKPSMCYHKIPIQVYLNLLERIPPEVKQQLKLDEQENIDRLAFSLETRYSHAHKKGNIDVVSKPAMLAFANNGLLDDHIEGMPPFNTKERKMILQSLREHMVRKTGGYHLYITEKDIGHNCSVFKNACLVYEFPDSYTNAYNHNYPFAMIENKMIAEIFSDYITHHIPAYHAMPEEEAVRFMDRLIEMLDDE